MSREPNFSKMVFKDQYDTLSDQEKKEFREEFLLQSGLSYPAFYLKLRTDTFKLLEEKCFNELIAKYKIARYKQVTSSIDLIDAYSTKN